MDSIDRAILSQLVNNGRASNREIASAVGMSESQCSRRISSLEQSGVVTHYTAAVDWKKLGIGLEILLAIRLVATDAETTRAFEATVRELPIVSKLLRVMGASDYLATLRAPTIDEVVDFLNQLAQIPRVGRFESVTVLEEVFDRGFDLDALQ